MTVTPPETPVPLVGPPAHLDPAPTKFPGSLGKTPEELADVVFLRPEGSARIGFADPLARELVRQSLAISAREEFGLRVGDASLG